MSYPLLPYYKSFTVFFFLTAGSYDMGCFKMKSLFPLYFKKNLFVFDSLNIGDLTGIFFKNSHRMWTSTFLIDGSIFVNFHILSDYVVCVFTSLS